MIATYSNLKRTLAAIKTDIDILSGETVGPSGSTWQDVAGNCAYNLRDLAALMDLAARRPTAVVSFPAWPKWASNQPSPTPKR